VSRYYYCNNIGRQATRPCTRRPNKAADSSTPPAPPPARGTTHRAGQHAPSARQYPPPCNHFVFSINKMNQLNMISPHPRYRRALDLHPPQPLARIQDGIIPLTIAHGLVTLNPSPTALCRKAASASSPVRLVVRAFLRSGATLFLHSTVEGAPSKLCLGGGFSRLSAAHVAVGIPYLAAKSWVTAGCPTHSRFLVFANEWGSSQSECIEITVKLGVPRLAVFKSGTVSSR
jgi:hypothetical protein